MLRNSGDMKGLTIHATDGEIGMVDHFYFDDESWVIRYLVVDTGGWLSGLSGHLVLISPYALGSTDWHARQLNVRLTKAQVTNSPEIDTHKPVSRQHETEFGDYYGYPQYWSGPYLWGSASSPQDFIPPLPGGVVEQVLNVPVQGNETTSGEKLDDSRLRSTKEVTGYTIEAAEGELGHVAGFVIDDETWAVRYIEVATRNWWPGKKVLVPPAWIKSVTWEDSQVNVDLYRDKIQNSPEYVESEPVSRDYEDRLYQHYGRPPYWMHEATELSARP